MEKQENEPHQQKHPAEDTIWLNTQALNTLLTALNTLTQHTLPHIYTLNTHTQH